MQTAYLYLWTLYARLFMPWDACGMRRADFLNVLAVFAVYAPPAHAAVSFAATFFVSDVRHTMVLVAITLDMLLTSAIIVNFSSYLARHAACLIDVNPVVPHEVGLAAAVAVYYLLYELRLRVGSPRAWVVAALGIYSVLVPWALIHLVSFTLPQVSAAFAIGVFSGSVSHAALGWVLVRRASSRAPTKTAGRAAAGRTVAVPRFEFSP